MNRSDRRMERIRSWALIDSPRPRVYNPWNLNSDNATAFLCRPQVNITKRADPQQPRRERELRTQEESGAPPFELRLSGERITQRSCRSKRRGSAPSALQDRRHAHAARRADRDQSAAGAALGKLFGERTDDARARRRKRVSQRDATALRIELGPIDAAQRPGPLQLRAAIFLRFPGLERAEHLRGKRFVNFVDIEILQRD